MLLPSGVTASVISDCHTFCVIWPWTSRTWVCSVCGYIYEGEELPDDFVCPVCGVSFYGPGAEELAFNSQGACKCCGGTGTVRTVDESTLIPDETLSIDEGAVAPWNSLMWSLMTDVCRAMGVRTDIPFRDLTEKEKETLHHADLQDNLYIADATLLPRSMGNPPMLTIMALAKKIAAIV